VIECRAHRQKDIMTVKIHIAAVDLNPNLSEGRIHIQIGFTGFGGDEVEAFELARIVEEQLRFGDKVPHGFEFSGLSIDEEAFPALETKFLDRLPPEFLLRLAFPGASGGLISSPLMCSVIQTSHPSSRKEVPNSWSRRCGRQTSPDTGPEPHLEEVWEPCS